MFLTISKQGTIDFLSANETRNEMILIAYEFKELPY